MDDHGINKWLLDNYGTTFDGRPLFRLIWSTGLTEKRHSEFSDFYGEILIRTVTEVREVLKYPFAQDRWVLEKIGLIGEEARRLGLGVDGNYAYEEVYICQGPEGEFLPISQHIIEVAMHLYFRFYLMMTPKERADMRTEMLAKRDLAKRNETREKLGEMRSPFGFVLE